MIWPTVILFSIPALRTGRQCDKWIKALQNKVVADDQPLAAEPVFEKDTPLSALFRDNFHGELRKVIESWRPYLIDDDASVDALA